MKSEAAQFFAGLSALLLFGGMIDFIARIPLLSETFGESGAAYMLLFLAVVSFGLSRVLEWGAEQREAEERSRALRDALEREKESADAVPFALLRRRDL